MYVEKTSQLTIYTNYKNLLQFTTTKKLNKKQIQQLKLLKQYKFKIQYILKKNVLNKKNNYINKKNLL